MHRWSSAASARNRSRTACTIAARSRSSRRMAATGAGAIVPLKANVDAALKDGGHPVKRVIVFRRAGNDIHIEEGRDVWWHREMEYVDANCPPVPLDSEHPLFILYTSGSTGKPKGILHTTGGYLLGAYMTLQVRLRSARRGCLLVHRRHRLGDRPQLCGLRPAGHGRHVADVRRRAELAGQRPLLEDHRGLRRDDSLHRADGDPRVHQVGRRMAEEVRSQLAAPARHGRRADQSRGVDVVSQCHRRRALPDRRYLVADGDRRPHDHAAARRDADQAGHGHAAVLRRRCRGRG